jgi:hypothetical protein
MLKEKIGKVLKTSIKVSGAAARIITGVGATVLALLAFKKSKSRK